MSEDTENAPSFFQLIFFLNGIQYRYGFEVTNNHIVSEWLYGTPNQREVCFFIREGNVLSEINDKQFGEGKRLLSLFGDENEIFRNNSLFLSAVAAMNGKSSKQIISALISINLLNGLNDPTLMQIARTSLNNDKTKKDIIDFLKFADTGILDLDLIEVTKEFINKDTPQTIVNAIEDGKQLNVIRSTHQIFNKSKEPIGVQYLNFEYTQSEGTIKMLELSPIIMYALEQGKTLIIDEFDARFHPLITKKIVELFNSKANKNAQLIFVTHDTNLLSHDLLRRDQIDFVEKDKYAASHIYSLVQFKGIRNNASFEKDYINGKYGAIPFLGDFNKLFNTEKDA